MNARKLCQATFPIAYWSPLAAVQLELGWPIKGKRRRAPWVGEEWLKILKIHLLTTSCFGSTGRRGNSSQMWRKGHQRGTVLTVKYHNTKRQALLRQNRSCKSPWNYNCNKCDILIVCGVGLLKLRNTDCMYIVFGLGAYYLVATRLAYICGATSWNFYTNKCDILVWGFRLLELPTPDVSGIFWHENAVHNPPMFRIGAPLFSTRKCPSGKGRGLFYTPGSTCINEFWSWFSHYGTCVGIPKGKKSINNHRFTSAPQSSSLISSPTSSTVSEKLGKDPALFWDKNKVRQDELTSYSGNSTSVSRNGNASTSGNTKWRLETSPMEAAM